ncbi:hypothetical protein GBA52_028747 [Prunus armeniaca]|nr:hypothetical protein GBA52_028747 [Prunus armeniaca]
MLFQPISSHLRSHDAFEEPGPDLNDFISMSHVFQLSGIQRKTDLPTSSKWQDQSNKIGLKKEEPVLFFLSHRIHRRPACFRLSGRNGMANVI